MRSPSFIKPELTLGWAGKWNLVSVVERELYQVSLVKYSGSRVTEVFKNREEN